MFNKLRKTITLHKINFLLYLLLDSVDYNLGELAENRRRTAVELLALRDLVKGTI